MDADINKILQGMAEDILTVMQYILDENGQKDSNLKKELYTKVEEEGDNVILRLFANHYIYWVDQGRKPTNMPPMSKWANPVGDISAWCRRKGIPADNSTVWAIIKKIHKYGYEGRFFLDTFWREAERTTYDNLDKLFDAITSELTEWFNK